jgi:hypothetical protein
MIALMIWRHYVPLKHLSTSRRLHEAIAQKALIFTLAAVSVKSDKILVYFLVGF